MFIPLLWSGGPREEEVGPDEDRDCPMCGSAQHFTIVAMWDELGVWPLKNARWNACYVTRCDTCGREFKSSYRPPKEGA